MAASALQGLQGKQRLGSFRAVDLQFPSSSVRGNACLLQLNPPGRGLPSLPVGTCAAERCDFGAPPITCRLRSEMIGDGQAPALVTASLPGTHWETSVLSWSLLGVKRWGTGVHGWGWVISRSGGTVTSIAAPSLADFRWFNATVPVSRVSGGSLDDKPFATAPASFPFSPFPTLCRSLP